MSDQGWMIDDGTCDACLFIDCGQCVDTHEEFGDAEVLTVCCCDEQYVLYRLDSDQEPGGDSR